MVALETSIVCGEPVVTLVPSSTVCGAVPVFPSTSRTNTTVSIITESSAEPFNPGTEATFTTSGALYRTRVTSLVPPPPTTTSKLKSRVVSPSVGSSGFSTPGPPRSPSLPSSPPPPISTPIVSVKTVRFRVISGASRLTTFPASGTPIVKDCSTAVTVADTNCSPGGSSSSTSTAVVLPPAKMTAVRITKISPIRIKPTIASSSSVAA